MSSNDGYLGNSSLKRVGEAISYTEDQAIELARCIDDPVYFIKTTLRLLTLIEV